MKTLRLVLAGAICLAIPLAGAFAEVLVLRDGTRIAGKCSIAGKEVTVESGMGVTYVPRASIERVELLPREQTELDGMKRAGDSLSARGQVRIGRWLDEHLQFEEADKCYAKAIEVDPDYEPARSVLGYRRAGKGWEPDVAKQVERAMLGFGAKAADACVKLAKGYDPAKQAKQIETALRRALVADPSQQEAIKLIQPYLAGYKPKHALRVPVDGDWTRDESYDHKFSAYMYNAIDFVKADAQGKFHSGDGKKFEDYYAFGRPIYAAADGEVFDVKGDFPDTPIGAMGDFLKANSVCINHGKNEYTLYAHFRKGSVKVRKGQFVKKGTLLGEVGNSGSSSLPHLHFCLYDGDGISLPITFEDAPAAK